MRNLSALTGAVIHEVGEDLMLALRQIPNLLTLLRIALVLPFAWFVYLNNFNSALLVFFIAGLSDAVDGFLARQFNWRSRFGAMADPAADKLLLVTAYVMLAWMSQIPMWLCILVMARDLVIVLGALLYYRRFGRYEIKPSIWGKLCTLLQILFVLLILIEQAWWPLSTSVLLAGQWAVAVTTVFSGVHYVSTWTRKAWRALH